MDCNHESDITSLQISIHYNLHSTSLIREFFATWHISLFNNFVIIVSY